MTNSPHLRPAFILDRVVKRIAKDIGEGVWVEKGIPQGKVYTAEHIEVCKDLFINVYLPIVKIPELFLPDVDKTVAEFEDKLRNCNLSETSASNNTSCYLLKIDQDPQYRRNRSTVDIEAALNRYKVELKVETDNKEEKTARCVMQFKDELDCLGKGTLKCLKTYQKG